MHDRHNSQLPVLSHQLIQAVQGAVPQKQQSRACVDAESVTGAKVLFGGSPLEGHSIPDCYGAIKPTAVFVPLEEILKDENFDLVTTEVFGPVQVCSAIMRTRALGVKKFPGAVLFHTSGLLLMTGRERHIGYRSFEILKNQSCCQIRR